MEAIITTLIASVLTFAGIWYQEYNKNKKITIEFEALKIEKEKTIQSHNEYKRDVEMHGKMLVFDSLIFSAHWRSCYYGSGVLSYHNF